MKEIEFGEERLGDLEGLARELFSQPENDPRSLYYQRKLERPTICWKKVLLYTVVPIVGAFLLGWILRTGGVKLWICGILAVAALLVYWICFLKKALICAIHIYQRYAPAGLRNKCRFEPSCSQYMIGALEKYGLLKGLRKGVDRLRRCTVSDGGYDPP